MGSVVVMLVFCCFISAAGNAFFFFEKMKTDADDAGLIEINLLFVVDVNRKRLTALISLNCYC